MRKPKPHGLIIALQVIGSLVLTNLFPWQVKSIIAETIGIRTEDIAETRTTRQRVTARIRVNRRNEERLKKLEKQDVTFNWNNGDLRKTTVTMIKALRYEETRRTEKPQNTPQPPTTNAWTERRSNPARPAGGHSDVGARGRETAPCPGGCPGAGAGSGAAGATETRTKLREITIADFKDKCVKLIQTEFIAERTKRRVDMLEKEVQKLTGKKPYQEEEYNPTREYLLSQMESIKQPTEQYLNNLSDRVEKLWKMMDQTMEKSFQLMEMIHQEKLSKITEQTPKNTETPKTPTRKNQIYRKEDQDAEGDADSEESEPEIKERKKRKTKRRKDSESGESRPPTPTASLNTNDDRVVFNYDNNASSEEETNRTEPRMTRARSALKQ